MPHYPPAGQILKAATRESRACHSHASNATFLLQASHVANVMACASFANQVHFAIPVREIIHWDLRESPQSSSVRNEATEGTNGFRLMDGFSGLARIAWKGKVGSLPAQGSQLRKFVLMMFGSPALFLQNHFDRGRMSRRFGGFSGKRITCPVSRWSGNSKSGLSSWSFARTTLS
jgi:hypothetical protein